MASPYLTEFIALATVHFLAVASPGPDFAVAISQSVRYGRRIGIYTALGIGSGISIHVAYTLLGMGALMHASPKIELAARVLGSAYLLYLAFQLLRSQPTTTLQPDSITPQPSPAFSAGSPHEAAPETIPASTSHYSAQSPPPESAPPSIARQSPRKAFVKGFLTNATNPKATLFFLAIFTSIISSSTPLSIQALYGAWMCIITALWFSLVSLLFSQPQVRSNFIRIGHWFERLMGLILAAFAIRLLLLI